MGVQMKRTPDEHEVSRLGNSATSASHSTASASCSAGTIAVNCSCQPAKVPAARSAATKTRTSERPVDLGGYQFRPLSRRQDLNLRPLDPQDVGVDVCPGRRWCPAPCARPVDVRGVWPRAGRMVPKWSPTALFVSNPDPWSGGASCPTVCASRGAIPCRPARWHAGCRDAFQCLAWLPLTILHPGACLRTIWRVIRRSWRTKATQRPA
jgi:hypothetical protein